MKITLLGGDRRIDILGELLRADGHSVMRTRSLEAAAAPDALILPVPVSRDGEAVLLSDTPLAAVGELPDGLPLLGGALPPSLAARRNAFDFLRDEETVVENARLTAFAALSVLLSEPPSLLDVRPVVILGFGRIARKLAMLLLALGVTPTVLARRESARSAAAALGARTAEFSFPVTGAPVLAVNTAPSPVTLPTLPKGSVLFDLAGLSLSDRPQNVDVRPLPGLPGKYYPESAARQLYFAAKRFLSTL